MRHARMKSEDGFALVLVLLALLVVSGLAAAMVTSGRTEVLVSVNQERAVQARAAAEAGLNHAAAVAIVRVRNFQANGFADSTSAITDLLIGPDDDPSTLADNGSLAPYTGGVLVPGTRVVLSAATGTSYEAVVMDDDDPSRGMSAADHVRVGEPTANAAFDENNRFVVRAIGYGTGGTTATLEATIGPIILPAIVTNDSLTISGNPTINGSNGSVHSNGDLLISGSATNITQNATSSGTYTTTASPTIGGQSGGGFPTLPIPPVNAADHRALADFILGADGNMRTQAGAIVCGVSAASACDAAPTNYGWGFSASGMLGLPEWDIHSNDAANGTYYVEGHAHMSGSPGSAATPLEISIIAEGNIHITGNPDLRPDLPELMLVTNMDLVIAGSLSQPIAFEGQMLVREQLSIAGNPSLAGQILVQNVPTVSTLVTDNTISGNPTITYNGITGTNIFVVTGWREIR